MAQNVIEAFREFMKNTINLDPDKTKIARTSRNWLVDQILGFPDKQKDFPVLYVEKNIYFGSFDRRTKESPLDDIDLMTCLHAMGCTYAEYSGHIEIYVPQTSEVLKKLCNDGTSTLNSKKVVNLFVNALKEVPQYKNAEEIKRNMEAAKLQLTSYDWNFDIVPCFFTTVDSAGKTYYIIPDGNGNWKKTDPRMDRDRVNAVNTLHGGYVLQVIRAIKYWNSRPTMPTIGSYLLENMILDYYANKTSKTQPYVDMEIVDVLNDLRSRVYLPVMDPKNIQGDLNTLTHEERKKIAERAHLDWEKAKEARKLENEKADEKAINKWREVFGDEFPKYEVNSLIKDLNSMNTINARV